MSQRETVPALLGAVAPSVCVVRNNFVCMWGWASVVCHLSVGSHWILMGS